MVEKVFISPNRVRAYGNIINMKTGDDFTLVNSELTVTTDTVNGAEMTVFQFEVEGGISIALVSSASTCNVGDNVLLTATVLDDSAPVEAAEVTFKVGETVLGTDETDANGVATYTYSASTAGTFSFTAVYQTSTSPVVSVSVNHSYSIAFSQSTYTASGGSATLECTLLEDNVAKSGASVTVTGSDGSVYNGITNSQGIASVTVSNVSTATTFTASYSNVSDTCTVTVSSIIWEDDFNRSSLGSDWVTFGTGANASISNNQLVLTRNGNGRGGIYYNQQVTGDYKITLDFASGDYDNVNLGIAISGTSWKCYEVEPKWYFGYITINSSGNISSSLHEQRTSGINYTSATIVYEVIQDTSIKMYINGTLKGTYNVQDGTTDGYIGVAQCCGRTSKYNSIKVEPI